MDIGFGQDLVSVFLAGNLPDNLAELKSVLSKEPGIRIVGVATDCRVVLRLVHQTHPDLLILSLVNPDDKFSDWYHLRAKLAGKVLMVLYDSNESITHR
jgi:chemotaxis response regulator CheB